MSWDHSGVFNALADRFGTNESVTNPLTWLYAQQPDCAVLYADWAVFKNHPLHINPGRSSWLPATYKAILPAIELVKLETKIDKYRYDRFLCFEIVDWDAFAAGLRLDD